MTMSTTTRTTHDATLPYCQHCGGRDWRSEFATHDGHRSVQVHACEDCGAIGTRINRYGTAGIDYDGAFDV